MTDISAVIKTIRQTHEYSLERFASIINVSKSIVQKWESGEHYPSRHNLKKIADRFGRYFTAPFLDEDLYVDCGIGIPLYEIEEIHSSGKMSRVICRIASSGDMLDREFEEYFAVTIEDNVMISCGMKNADTAIFEPCDRIEESKIGMFLVDGNAYSRRFESIDGTPASIRPTTTTTAFTGRSTRSLVGGYP